MTGWPTDDVWSRILGGERATPAGNRFAHTTLHGYGLRP
jgi:hypothetical protein